MKLKLKLKNIYKIKIIDYYKRICVWNVRGSESNVKLIKCIHFYVFPHKFVEERP